MADKSQAPRKRKQAPRLYHTKSRHGCFRCRQRRVKCDESHPICNNCHRHNVPCIYDRPPGGNTVVTLQSQQPAATTLAMSSVPSSGSSPSESFSDRGGITTRNEYWKLRTLHHFTIATSATMPASHIPSVRDCWAQQVPVLALEHEPLLNALLAFSSLHIIATGTDDVDLSACRAAWLETALRSHRHGLDELNKNNIDAACFTSSLLHVDGFATLRDRPLEPYEPPLRWFRMLWGTRTVVETYMPIMETGDKLLFSTLISSYSEYKDGGGAYYNHGDRLSHEPLHLLDRNTRPTSAFAHLLDDHGLGDMSDPKTAETYRQAVVYIGWMKNAVDSRENTLSLYRKLVAFPSLIDRRFPDLIEENAPRALIILAHLFSFGMYLRDIWTMGEIPQREVGGLCKLIPSRLQHLVAWPLSIISQNGTIIS